MISMEKVTRMRHQVKLTRYSGRWLTVSLKVQYN